VLCGGPARWTMMGALTMVAIYVALPRARLIR